MIWPFLFAIGLLALIVHIVWNELHSNGMDWAVWFFAVFFGGIGLCIASLIGIGLGCLIGASQPPSEWKLVGTTELRSVTDYNGITGTFYLFGGTVGDKTYYSYWYPEGTGLRHAQLSDSDNVKVFEDSSSGGKLLHYHRNCKDGDGSLLWICPRNDNGYDFHVPSGTVATTISLK